MLSRPFIIYLVLLLVLIAVFFVPITGSNSPAREWTAKSGHKITGNFVSLQNGSVAISLPNGTVAEIPLDQLSDADQKFVETQTAKKEDNPFKIVQDTSAGAAKLAFNTPRHVLEQEAQKNNPEALLLLAYRYYEGFGVSKDEKRAQELFQRGAQFADTGNPAAQYCRARCYVGGLGVSMNLTEAERWYRLAAAQEGVAAELARAKFGNHGVATQQQQTPVQAQQQAPAEREQRLAEQQRQAEARAAAEREAEQRRQEQQQAQQNVQQQASAPLTAPTFTPIEQAEVDKLIAEHGLNVIQRYMSVGNLNRNDADRILRYLTYFVIQGANVNAKGAAGALGGSGFTALHAATTLGKVEIARFLVSQGADINALWSTAGAELTPLDLGTLHVTRTDAIRIDENHRRGVGEVVAYLKSIGAKTGGGGTPMFLPPPESNRR